MQPLLAKNYQFGDFLLDTQGQRLLQGDTELPLQPKTFEVLLQLVQHAGQTVSRDELITSVWGLSISDGVLNFQINQIRKLLGDPPSQPHYVKTITKRGFQFIAPTREIPLAAAAADADVVLSSSPPGEPGAAATQPAPGQPAIVQGELAAAEAPSPDPPSMTPNFRRRFDWIWKSGSKRGLKGAVAVALLAAAAIFLLFQLLSQSGRGAHPRGQLMHSLLEEDAVRRVVKESQVFETLHLYTEPRPLTDSQLAQYWVPAEAGGKEVNEVRASINRLLSKGWHYGGESRLEIFEFTATRVYEPGDYAEVETMEKWFLPMYQADGSRVLDRNVFLGPMTIAYKLKKFNGAWLIDETTVPRPRQHPQTQPGAQASAQLGN